MHGRNHRVEETRAQSGRHAGSRCLRCVRRSPGRQDARSEAWFVLPVFPRVNAWRFGPSDATGDGCYILRTDIEKKDPNENLWFPHEPDPGIEQASWAKLGGGAPTHPVALERSHYDWSHAGIVAFPNGVVGATGYGNNNDQFPAIYLGVNKVPTAVAVSNNNELAFVTVWDTAKTKGQLAVIALEGRVLSNIGDNKDNVLGYIGLMNIGGYSRMKLLGFVDLPVNAPTAVSVMTDGANAGAFLGERFPGERPFPKELLDTQAARDFWANEPAAPQGYRARGGFALVASRSENQVVVVDLGPLIRWFRTMYFSTQERFDQTKQAGDAANQWPFAFSVAPPATPTVATVLDIPQPTAILAGWPQADGLQDSAKEPRERAYIATLKGELQLYRIGGWLSAKPITADNLGVVPVGRNPTALAVGHEWNVEDRRNQLLVVSRGDREVAVMTAEAVLIKTLRDQRMKDPVAVQTTENHDLRISDFHGKQVLTYLYGPLGVSPLASEYIWLPGADGKADFEFSQAFARKGSVFSTSSVLFF